MNKFFGIGRLTRDPELRSTNTGMSVTTFTVAINRPFKNQDGEYEADFINVVTFRQQADNVKQFLSKGSQCAIDGRVQSRNYENKEGQRVFVTEIVADRVQFLDSKGSNSGTGGQQNNSYTNAYGSNKKRSNVPDENPFGNDTQSSDLPF